MRRSFALLAIAVVAAAITLIAWIFGARSLSMLIDRIHTGELDTKTIIELGVEDAPAGILRINGLRMSTAMPDNRAFRMKMEMDAQGLFTVTINRKTIALGPVIHPSEDGSGALVRPARGDQATFKTSRSLVSWPTPFDFNFMTGHSPSWKRHLYYRLLWRKPEGNKLEMLWRYEQWFYGGEEWSSGFMTHEGTTRLLWAK